jgi:hypothetical protein
VVVFENIKEEKEFRRFVYEIEGAHLFLFDLNISVSKK